MRMLRSITVCLARLLGAFLLSQAVNGANDAVVQINILPEESNLDHRFRRTLDSHLPDHIACSFPFHKDNVMLRLKRSRLLPVVTSDTPDMEAVNLTPHDSAVFIDSSAGSAMIVKRVNGDYRLDGSFFHNNKEWTLRPLTKFHNGHEQMNSGSFHLISPVIGKNTTTSFINDVLLDTEDKPQQLYTKSIQKSGVGLHRTWTNRKGLRRKRATKEHVIEVAFIADFEDYSKWRRHVGAENAVSAMRLWYTFTAESINIRFQTIKEPDLSISITVTVLKILTNPNDASFISNSVSANGVLRGPEGLNAFGKWYPRQPDIPPSDHYMLMTGYDVMGSSGIAISSRMCTEFSMSICEDSFTGSLGGVAAHELGHSLSAVHDFSTTGPNACSDKDQYIMSTVFTSPVAAGNEGNPWRFSPCSIKSIKAFLDEVTCTLPEQTSRINQLPLPSESNKAGQVLFRNAQCVLAFQDSRSSFCQAIQMQNGGLSSLCGGMYCSIPGDWMGACQTVVPQEFTPCGTGKWCVTGRCVDMESPSSTSTSSPTATTTLSPFTVPETATSTTTDTRGSIKSTEVRLTPREQTTPSTTIRNKEVTNVPTITEETTVSDVYSTSAAENITMMSTLAAVLTAPTITTIPTITDGPTTPARVTTKTSLELATTPFSTNSTQSGIQDVSMCNYLIYLKKGTEWWHCVQRALGRTEAAPRSVRRRIPTRRGRIYIRRFRFIS